MLQKFKIERGFDEEYTVLNVLVTYSYHKAHKAPRENGQPIYPDEAAGIDIEEVTLQGHPFQLTEKEQEKIEHELYTKHTDY